LLLGHHGVSLRDLRTAVHGASYQVGQVAVGRVDELETLRLLECDGCSPDHAGFEMVLAGTLAGSLLD
jgi:hypothetical protein